ncbi:titin-like [Salvelinus sp. IW2-2015]|uniref:titin-like n=1 Tax=Salvelinus sp. IW2-2015 TaxID=2691554 RepID=UPI0038D481B7
MTFSSFTVSAEEEKQESYFTGLQLGKSKTLELKPESKLYSSTMEKKKEKPVFVTQLSPVAVTIGDIARFTVTISCLPKPNVQWFHNGRVITSSSVYTFVQERDEYTLVINKVEKEFEGEYSCTASNRFGQSTCTTFLNIQVSDTKKPERQVEKMFKPTGQPPEFIKTIEPVQCSEGGLALFKYIVTGNPLPEVQWLKGSYQIQPSKYCIVVNNPDGSGFINMKGIQKEDSGLYTCKASNPSGEASCSAELIVFRESVSISQHQEQHVVVQKQKGYKVSMTEQATESRLYMVNLPGEARARDQMVYTIGTEDRQVISSEQVDTLRELDISAATLHRERVTHQAAVLQSQEVEERVSVTPTRPPPASAAPIKQLHMAAFTSAVQESQKLVEQHSDRIQSPEILELVPAREHHSNIMSATSEEVIPLITVRTEVLGDRKPEQIKSSKEPKQVVSSHLVETRLPILKEKLGITTRPEEERSFRVTEGVKILYTATSTGQLPLSECHCDTLSTSDKPTQSLLEKERPNLVVAPVSETQHTLSKEQRFEIHKPKQESALVSKDRLFKSAMSAEEKHLLQTEHSKAVPGLESAMSLQFEKEEEQLLHLQMISKQDILQSEGRFTCEKQLPESADARKSPTLLHTVTHNEWKSVTCEKISEFSAQLDTISIEPRKEAKAPLHLQSIQSESVLPKEGILSPEKPDQQTAVQKQERARKHAATSEDKREFSADYSKDLDVSVTGVQSELRTEPRPQNILQVTSQPMQLPKETPFTSDVKQQRALIEKEDRWNIMQSVTVVDTQSIEEGHTISLKANDAFKPVVKIEPKIPTKPVYIEEKAIATEGCAILHAAEQDFAVQIHEGQSVRQSILLEEKHIIVGEQSSEIGKSAGLVVSVKTQPKGVLFVHESQESQVLPKELTFVIPMPKATTLGIRHQLKTALQSAVARDQPLILADVVERLEAVEVQEVKVGRETKDAMFTYLITTPGAPMEITIAFEGEYTQTADLRTELQAAFHAIVYREQQTLILDQPGTMQIVKPQKTNVSSAKSKEMLSSVVETVRVTESAAGFASPVAQSAAQKTETMASFQSIAQDRTVVHESRQTTRQETRSVTVKSHDERDVGAADLTTAVPFASVPVEQSHVFIQRETMEEFLSEAVMISKLPEQFTKAYPIIVTPLEDICSEKNSMVTFSVTIMCVTKVNWLFNGKLVKSGKEFKCSKDNDTYTLVIGKIVKEKHEGEYVCEAENEAGKATTTSRLTVVSRGWIMGIFSYFHKNSN